MSQTVYKTTVGIEVHVELTTRTKIFCSCPNAPQDMPPNRAVCPVCLGLPGALPTANREAVRLGIAAALALNCAINERIWFERKNYIYPDLVKGYQISQYVMPLGEHGWLGITGDDGQEKKITIRRLHLEEDTAKLSHVDGRTLIDVNRSSVPLMEIVTDPVINSGREAEEYVRKLRAILVYNGISRCRIQHGEMRVEANVSVAPRGSDQLGVRTEIKNQAGFNHMRSAIEYEEKRHASVLESGGTLRQETRGWDDVNQRTFIQRDKEDAHDYRYFPEPDLPPIRISPEWVEQERQNQPQAYDSYLAGLLEKGLSEADLEALSRNDALGFLRLAAHGADDKVVLLAKRLVKDVFSLVNSTAVPLDEAKLTPEAFRLAVELAESGKITAEGFRTVLEKLYKEGGDPQQTAESLDLFVDNDEGAVMKAVEKVFAESAAMVDEFLAGKTVVRNALLGKTMKTLKAMNIKADPRTVGATLDAMLAEKQ